MGYTILYLYTILDIFGTIIPIFLRLHAINMCLYRGNYNAAGEHLQETLALFCNVGNQMGIVWPTWRCIRVMSRKWKWQEDNEQHQVPQRRLGYERNLGRMGGWEAAPWACCTTG